MNKFRRIVDKAQRQAISRSNTGEPLPDDASLQAIGTAGIPASATTVSYDSIQRLLLVRGLLLLSRSSTLEEAHAVNGRAAPSTLQRAQRSPTLVWPYSEC